MYKVFLDTNVFVYGEHINESNSRIILDLAEKGEVEVVITEALITEVRATFENLHDRQTGINEAYFIKNLPNRVEIGINEIKKQVEKRKDVPLKEFDLLHYIASLLANVDFLITSDTDFFEEQVKKHINIVSPKKFVKTLELRSYETRY